MKINFKNIGIKATAIAGAVAAIWLAVRPESKGKGDTLDEILDGLPELDGDEPAPAEEAAEETDETEETVEEETTEEEKTEE